MYKPSTKTWQMGWLIMTIGNIGYSFSFWVQENAYGRPNFLKPLSDLLADQVIATSFFVCLAAGGGVLLASYCISGLLKRPLFFIRPVLLLIEGAVYTSYELNQMNNLTYHDWCVGDIIGCWTAILIVYVMWLKTK